MAEQTKSREQEIKAIWKDYAFFYRVLGGVILVGLGILIGLLWFASDLDRSAYIVNLYTSLLSVAVTVFVIDLLNRRRDEQGAIMDLQNQLVRDARSIVNDVANNAVYQMEARGWLIGEKGLLQGASLSYANLRGAILGMANLRGAFLLNTNLQEAFFQGAHLEGANLRSANLQGANLASARLQGAILWNANLQGANLASARLQDTDLRSTNLQDTNLRLTRLQGADLQSANLQGAQIIRGLPPEMNEETILPDGSHWTPDTDLTKFGVIYED